MPPEKIKEYWIVVDNSTGKALYGLKDKTLIFNSKYEADNFGKQMCKTVIATFFKRLI